MNKVIVIADDDQEVVDAMEANLALEGYDIHIAGNGQEAYDKAVELQPDLVILDVVMPVMDGFQTCKAIRDDPRTSSVAVILLTAQTIASDKVRGLTIGADDYIVKPFDWEELAARVKSVLRRASQMRDVSPLTHLPGTFRISSELESLVASRENNYAAIYLDINDFKSINDRYGFSRGDEVIKFMGKMLTGVLADYPGNPSVLGHTGGDAFVLVVPADGVEAVCEDIITKFDDGIKEFYDDDAIEQGFIEVMNRRKDLIKHNICSVAIGVVSAKLREVHSQWEISVTANEMRIHAKTAEKSSYEIDRRRSDDQFRAMLDGFDEAVES